MPPASAFSLQSLFNLAGSVAVVTGGGTGIGQMIAQGLAGAGAKVYITGRRVEVLQKLADAWDGNGKLIPLQMDVTDKSSIQKAKEQLMQKEGKLNVLVNNAGQVGPVSKFMFDQSQPENKDAETLGNALFSEEHEGWDNVYRINAFSSFFVTTAFLGLLDKGAREKPGTTSSVINITSVSGELRIAQDHFAYNSSKAAATSVTRMLATEFALKNIPVRVNALSPGMFESEMTGHDISPEQLDSYAKAVVPIPAKRVGHAHEMAGTAVYLASPASGYMIGHEIVIDGGYTAVNPTY